MFPARSLRRQCSLHLDGIDIPRPFRLEDFAATVSARRSRPLVISPLPGLDAEDAPSGAWVATDSGDFVFVDAAASPWHRNLIALHEVGHMLWNHPSGAGQVGGIPPELLPALSPEAVQKILGRHGYDSRQEREAEMTAYIILERAAESVPPVLLPQDEPLVSRLAAVIEGPYRHD